MRALPNLRGIMIEQDPDSENPLQDMIASRRYLSGEFGL
jgi:hypothetical protein